MKVAADFETTNPTTYLGTAATVLIIAEMTRNRILPAGQHPAAGRFQCAIPIHPATLGQPAG